MNKVIIQKELFKTPKRTMLNQNRGPAMFEMMKWILL
jgi:hypothetical protein